MSKKESHSKMRRKVKLKVLQHKDLTTSLKEWHWKSKIEMKSKITKLNSRSMRIDQLYLLLEIGEENLWHEQSGVRIVVDLTKKSLKIQKLDEDEP